MGSKLSSEKESSSLRNDTLIQQNNNSMSNMLGRDVMRIIMNQMRVYQNGVKFWDQFKYVHVFRVVCKDFRNLMDLEMMELQAHIIHDEDFLYRSLCEDNYPSRIKKLTVDHVQLKSRFFPMIPESVHTLALEDCALDITGFRSFPTHLKSLSLCMCKNVLDNHLEIIFQRTKNLEWLELRLMPNTLVGDCLSHLPQSLQYLFIR